MSEDKERRGRLGGEVEAEQLLADDVVQLQGQTVALGQNRQLPAALVETSVGDGDGGVSGQQLDQLLVVGVKGRRGLLLGEIEGADHALLRGHDGYAEE
jgi:hypothetical protein